MVHRGQHALYLDLDGWCLGVVSASATAVPCAVVLPEPDLGPLTTAERVHVGAGRLVAHVGSDRVEIRIGRLREVTVPPLPHPDPSLVGMLAGMLLTAEDRKSVV